MITEFFRSDEPEPHARRTRALLASHPEARALIGPNSWTMAIAVGVVALQTVVGAFFGRLGLSWWWLTLIGAWCIGGFASHCIYVIIHEATHDLIFRRRWQNRCAALFADMPNVMPAATAFRRFHLMHHAYQGDYDRDLDLPSRWEARLFANSSIRKALWLLLFPIVQLTRTARTSSAFLFERWAILNYALSIGYAGAMLWFFGPGAVLYLVASFWFSIGLHPAGARWVQEHYTYDPSQETGSYYGPLNIVALNVGYHNEHHDLPSVAWNRLPRLTAMAPELYATLRSYPSWCRLVYDFVVDPRYSVASRVVRAGRNTA